MSTNEARAQRLAEEFRAAHDLGDAPIKDMFELVHATVSIDVLSMEASDAEHGLTMRDTATGRVVIAVATTPHPMRQRSSIAHELGHVVAGDLENGQVLTPGERVPEEIRADAFARHLLIPLAGIRRHLRPDTTTVTVKDLSDLVQEFEVSPHLAAIQLRTLKLINQATCATWSVGSTATLAANHGWLSQYRSLVSDSMSPRAPQNLMARAVAGYHHGVLGVAEIAAWYGQRPDELAEELGAPTNPESTEEDDDFWGEDTSLFPDDAQGSDT